MVSMSDTTTVLIVEDDDALRERLARAFASRGLSVRTAATAADAQREAAEDAPELVVLDLRIGQDHGLSLIPVFLGCDPQTKIVVLTGYGSIATAVEAVKAGALQYLTKPADADDILAAFFPQATRGTDTPLQSMSLDRLEWEHINKVLADCGHNVSEAARALGLHRRTLQRKLSKYPSKR